MFLMTENRFNINWIAENWKKKQLFLRERTAVLSTEQPTWLGFLFVFLTSSGALTTRSDFCLECYVYKCHWLFIVSAIALEILLQQGWTHSIIWDTVRSLIYNNSFVSHLASVILIEAGFRMKKGEGRAVCLWQQ